MRKVLWMSLLVSMLGGCAVEVVDEGSAPYDDEISADGDDSTLEGTSAALKEGLLGDTQMPVLELDFGDTVAARPVGSATGSWAGGCGDLKACNQQCDAVVIDCPTTNSEQTCNRRLENCVRRCDAMAKCNIIDL